MAKQYIWTSIPLDNATIVDDTNNVLDIILNGESKSLTLDKEGYMSNTIRHECVLVDRVNSLFIDNSINVECEFGIFADGNVRSGYIVFVCESTDSFSYDGTFKDLIGDIDYIKVEEDIVEDIETPVEEPIKE